MKRFLLALTLLVGFVASVPVDAAPPQGMPDPTQMSGIPRPDANLPPDVVTIRCLDGSFANPAIGVAVELELTAPDGTKTLLSATSAEQGRARFEGLSAHFGHNVTARATVAGQALTSQTFTLTGQTGFAVMLVASGGAGTPPKDPHGGQGDVPLPGKPFPLPDKSRGTLIVGALDLAEKGGPIAGVEVTLKATVPGVVEPIIKTATTDRDGRANFDGLDTELPAGAAIVVSADLGEGKLDQSESFVLGETGYAIVLVRNERTVQAPPQAPPERQVVFPARADRTLPTGKIRVLVIDADDRPVANQKVSAKTSTITGDEQIRSGKTDAGGEVILGFDDAADALAEVHTSYGGGPWTSGGFTMPDDSGALVVLKVFETTADRSIARSAMQIDVVGRENDFAAVTFMVAVFIEGDLAFWPKGGMRIFAPEGTRSLHVLPEAETWLVHDEAEDAPYVDLAGPLPPGVEIRLSFAVGIEHDGSLELDWTTPFPLVDGASLVTVPPELKVTHGVGGAPETNPHAGRDGGPLDIYRLGHERFQAGVCDRMGTSGLYCPFHARLGNDLSIVVEGLPIRSRVWPWTAWGLLGLAGVGILIALALRPRIGVREALIARRDALMVELLALDQAGPAAGATAEARRKRTRLLAGLDRIYRQLDATRS